MTQANAREPHHGRPDSLVMLGQSWFAVCLPCRPSRWRKLEGSDPSTYEMIQKIQTLQKRLIAKTEEVVEKDLLIQVAAKEKTQFCVGLVWRAGACRWVQLR